MCIYLLFVSANKSLVLLGCVAVFLWFVMMVVVMKVVMRIFSARYNMLVFCLWHMAVWVLPMVFMTRWHMCVSVRLMFFVRDYMMAMRVCSP